MNTVYVLGCGPAGLAAAHAATALGYEPVIFSKKRKSQMFGAQYLHKQIPNLFYWQPSSVEVSYQLRGSLEDYRRKVYGDAYDGTVSPGTLDANHLAWDIRSAYDMLWDKFRGQVVDVELSAEWVAEHITRFGPMISSVPLSAICARPIVHSFQSVDVWAVGEAPEWGIYYMVKDLDDNMVICNGLSQPSWYRASRIFGRTTIEWPAHGIPEGQGASKVRKPISTTCNCWPDVLRVGRYGKWQKGVLVHHAYEETWQWLVSGASQ